MKKIIIISTVILTSIFGTGAAKGLEELNQAKIVPQTITTEKVPATSKVSIKHRKNSYSSMISEDQDSSMTLITEEVSALNKAKAEELAKLEEERKALEAQNKAIQQKKNIPLRRIDANYTAGTKEIPKTLRNLEDQYFYYADMFGVDPYLLMAITSQECGGDLNCTGSAKGISQIEDSCVSDFINFGSSYFNQAWTEADRYDTNCALAYLSHKISVLLRHYNGDFEKAIQAYNFSSFSLDKLISAYGDDWISHRGEMAYYNGHYNRTGSTSYGDPLYIEHVMRYYYAE